MPVLPSPIPGRVEVEGWVDAHLGHLTLEMDVVGSSRFSGGQRAADVALQAFDVAGYAARRNEVLPVGRRGASALSPWIRHGLLTLSEVWDHVADGPERDVRKYRDELLWQEYARHVYARLGRRTAEGLRHERAVVAADGWDRSMACLDAVVGELESDGWLVNQTRMWLASDWTVRHGGRWQEGEDRFFQHLLDGSRAANRLGWQWTTGVGSSKPYGFSRWQVEKRAPGLCSTCPHERACPIGDWPDDAVDPVGVAPVELGKVAGPPAFAGPLHPESLGEPEAVWLTAESLGDRDPALVAHPDLPVVFVFDEPLLSRLRLSAKRLVFLAETLAELADHRDLEIRLGPVVDELDGRSLAVTHAPVPGFAVRSSALDVVVRHPFPWLRTPHSGSIRSFSAWRR